MDTRLREGIDWVGFVDWNVRDFHGYTTERGSTYNAYLVRDEKTALIDTVKAPYAGTLLEHVAALTDLSRVDYVVCNHAEPDHSGSLPAVMKAMPGAELVCDKKCRDTLAKYYDTTGWKFKVVASGETLSVGKRTLAFVETPMVHWPESMATYVPEEKLLFSMDAFGQHFASSGRFDDEEPLDVIMAEAKTYYANIVMLYGPQIAKTMDALEGIEVEIIAPSHGVIWRRNLDVIRSAYRDWVVCRAKPKVVIVYDTMWQSTDMMAKAIVEGAALPGVEVKLFNIRASSITVLATEVLDAAAIAVGSPTLNGTLMPQMAAVLTYLTGLRPAGKAGLAFGSYGWAKGAAKELDAYLRAMKVEILRDPVQAQFRPAAAALDECRAAGKLLAERALQAADRE